MIDRVDQMACAKDETADQRPSLVLLVLLLALALTGSPEARKPTQTYLRDSIYLFSTSDNALYISTEQPTGEGVAPATGLEPFFFRLTPVNSASSQLLQTLPGIGPGLAAKIVQWREEHGPLKSADELARIPGIGKKRAATLAASLDFGVGQ